jgi:hypothetical protein
VDFVSDDTVRTSSELKHDVSAVYPNLSVCYPKFFDKVKMDGEASGLASLGAHLCPSEI